MIKSIGKHTELYNLGLSPKQQDKSTVVEMSHVSVNLAHTNTLGGLLIIEKASAPINTAL